MVDVSAILKALKDPKVLAGVESAGRDGIDALVGQIDPAMRERLIRNSVKRIQFEAESDHVFAELAASDVALDLRTILNYTAAEARETANRIATVLLSAIGAALPGVWSAAIPILKGILL